MITETQKRGTRGAGRCYGAAVVAVALLLACSGCQGGVFGRPHNYTELAKDVADAFRLERYDILRDDVITNEDMRRMGEKADGDDRAPYEPAENRVHDCFGPVRKAGGDDGILWSEVTVSSISTDGAHNKYKEKVDVKVNLDSRGNHYQMLIRNAQLVDEGDVVLTDRIEWLGAR
ncbi:MAG TPA: hypothetical protein VL860_14090 [Planctomycetota bacterium]|nr:hypothetical protein [Planctomycetota bacterium]